MAGASLCNPTIIALSTPYSYESLFIANIFSNLVDAIERERSECPIIAAPYGPEMNKIGSNKHLSIIK